MGLVTWFCCKSLEKSLIILGDFAFCAIWGVVVRRAVGVAGFRLAVLQKSITHPNGSHSHQPPPETANTSKDPTANSQHQCQRQAEQDADVSADGSADVSADKATAATSDRRKKRATHQVSWAKKGKYWAGWSSH